MAEKRPGEPFTRIDVQEAKKMIDEEDVQVIDSREPHEHAEGHVPGSIQIQHMATMAQAAKIARDKPVLFICKSGQRSAVAAEFAAALGITDIYNVDGGHDAWRAAGYPLEEGM
ncbi:MAG: rhodanese-like domain-containing protein [Dehalococcoidia bacterium]|nr:rhodanese-like domain-containing protein [Dehalococcoidia bacterium]MCA9857137.1 rhodanese-like domain-containing protein [Dehalococcoidia bacterium]MCB9483452.1 rhodanese-like domain-containing protein [Dehalococcoidia bacterium]MCB9491543.1 rhodanese-like domain-containing protein [Dehalococcoidia bacterium]